MKNITKEKYELYKNALRIEKQNCIMELDEINQKYYSALFKYYQSDDCSVDKLNVIVDAFEYFTGFEIQEIPKVENLRQLESVFLSKSEAATPSIAEIIYMLFVLIGIKVSNAKLTDSQEYIDIVFMKIMSTIECIYNYEKGISKRKE